MCERGRDLTQRIWQYQVYLLVEICTAVEQFVRFIGLGYSNTSKPASLLSFSHVHERYMQQVSLKIFRRDIVIHFSIADITTTACCRLHKQCVFSRYQVCYTVDCSVHLKCSYGSYKFPTLWVRRERREKKRKVMIEKELE